MKTNTCFLAAFVLLLTAGLLVSCKKTDKMPVAAEKADVMFYALAPDNMLLVCDGGRKGLVEKTITITGLMGSEKMINIDFRPATGQLYGVSNGSRLYVINPESGVARALGSGPFTPALNDEDVSFDFNPVVDRIRLITAKGQNLRLHPETGGLVAEDGAINGVAGVRIEAAGYTNNMAGATSSVLYDIDVTTKKLYKQDPPNAGGLVEVGRLNANFTSVGDMDITPDNQYALTILNMDNKSTLYVVDLNTGMAKQVEQFSGAMGLLAIAIPTNPVAYGITAANGLVIFNPAKPEPVTKPITGLASEEMLLAIDFRPANGQLYAISNASKMYTLNLGNGAATMVGSMAFSTPLSGTSFGFDFNPTVDLIRLVSNSGQNLRLNPNTGAVQGVDGVLNPGTPMATGAAYTNNMAGATTTTLYVLNNNDNMLYKQKPPNKGTLIEGKMGTGPLANANGFDIGGMSGKAWFTTSSGANTMLYQLNLETGAATPAGTITGSSLTGFAVGLGF